MSDKKESEQTERRPSAFGKMLKNSLTKRAMIALLVFLASSVWVLLWRFLAPKASLICGVIPAVLCSLGVLVVLLSLVISEHPKFKAVAAEVRKEQHRKQHTLEVPPRAAMSLSCGNCGREVPFDVKPGMRCPHCGATWGYEQITAKKRCGKCGQPVPYASQVGQRCPHCNTWWSYEGFYHPST
jgi:DNA-directed RNA polymerase subunit RPC12/RpoP